MPANLPIRILGVFGIHVALGALFWAIVAFGFANQQVLAPSLIERIDGDPARLDTYIGEMSREAVVAGGISLAIAALCACVWLWLIDRNPPYGDKSARDKRGSWAGLMIAAVVIAVGIFWTWLIGAPIAVLLAASVPLKVAGIGMVLVVIGYWLSTAVFAPASTKVAVPGAGVFGG